MVINETRRTYIAIHSGSIDLQDLSFDQIITQLTEIKAQWPEDHLIHYILDTDTGFYGNSCYIEQKYLVKRWETDEELQLRSQQEHEIIEKQRQSRIKQLSDELERLKGQSK